jgi:putative oxidoreductase
VLRDYAEMAELRRLLLAGPDSGPRATLALAGRLVSGAVFVVFGIAKFTNHAMEVDSFRDYGLPSPDAFVYAIGTIEIVGGLLLIVGLGTRLAALVLAGNMVGAIVSSGLGQGEIISLTLAPFQLAVMVFLLVVGPGRSSLDRRMLSAGPEQRPAGPGTARPGRRGAAR